MYGIATILALENLSDTLISCIINLGMPGEMEEFDTLFKTGDSVNFKHSDFKDLLDPNIQLMLSISDNLDGKINSLRNINGITDREIEESIKCNDSEQVMIQISSYPTIRENT